VPRFVAGSHFCSESLVKDNLTKHRITNDPSGNQYLV